jgi:hypothetical protein
VEEDVALDPVDIGLLGPTAVVACANRVTDAIEESRLRRLSRGHFAKDGAAGDGRLQRIGPIASRSQRPLRPPRVAMIAGAACERQERIVLATETVSRKILCSFWSAGVPPRQAADLTAPRKGIFHSVRVPWGHYLIASDLRKV